MPDPAVDWCRKRASGVCSGAFGLWFFGVILGVLISALLAVALYGVAVGLGLGYVLGDDGRGVHRPAVITVLMAEIAVRVSVGSGDEVELFPGLGHVGKILGMFGDERAEVLGFVGCAVRGSQKIDFCVGVGVAACGCAGVGFTGCMGGVDVGRTGGALGVVGLGAGGVALWAGLGAVDVAAEPC